MTRFDEFDAANKSAKEMAQKISEVMYKYSEFIDEDQGAIDFTESLAAEASAYDLVKMTLQNAMKDLNALYKKYEAAEKKRAALYDELIAPFEEDEEEDEEDA